MRFESLLCLGTLVLSSRVVQTESFILEVTVRDFVLPGCNPNSNFDTVFQPKWPTTYEVCWASNIAVLGSTTETIPFPVPYDTTEESASGEFILVKAENYEQEEPEGYKLYPHPDFQSAYSGYTGFANSEASKLVVNEAGIPKPNYNLPVADTNLELLTNGFNSGENGGAISHSKEAFHAWYNDVPRVNKRVGTTIKLVQDSTFVFKYDEDLHSPEAIRNKELGRLSLANGRNEGFFGPIDGFSVSFNPFKAKTVWPPASFEFEGNLIPSGQTIPFSLAHKFGFTTEIHTFFQYRTGDSFTFSGDDDIYIYVNYTLAGEEPGKHGERQVIVDMDAITPPLVEGEFYPLDIFHAERQTTRSNVDLTVSLSEGCSVVSSDKSTLDVVLVSNSLVAVDDVPNVTFEANSTSRFYTTFLELKDELQLSGATIDPATGGLLLSSRAKPNSWSHAWLTQQVNIGRGFDVVFHYKIENDVGKTSGNGFALVMQDIGITDLQGGVSGHIGTRGLSGLILVLDHCADSESGLPNAPCSGFPTLRLEIGGEVVARARVFFDLDDGEEHVIRIRYFHSPDWVEVLHDNSLYLRATGVDMVRVLGSRAAYVGFTSSTSFDAADQYILSLLVQTMGIDASKTVLEGDVYASRAQVVADGSEPSSVVIRNFDNCEFPVTYGGNTELIQARLVEENGTAWRYNNWTAWPLPEGGRRLQEGPDPASSYYGYSDSPTVVDGEVVDLGDGGYTVNFRTEVAAEYRLELEYDGKPVCFNSTSCSPFPSAMAFKEYVPPPATEAPSFSAPGAPAGLPEEVLVGLGGAGGALGCCFIAAGVLFVRYRRYFDANFGFASKGKLAVLERGVDYDENGELKQLAHEYQRTREEINKLKALKDAVNYSDDINRLQRQRDEIQDNLKHLKRNLQEKHADRTSTRRGIISIRKRGDFRPSSSSLGSRFSLRRNRNASQGTTSSAGGHSLGPAIRLEDEAEEFSFSRPGHLEV